MASVKGVGPRTPFQPERRIASEPIRAGDYLMVDATHARKARDADGGFDGVAIEDRAMGEVVQIALARMPAYLYDILKAKD